VSGQDVSTPRIRLLVRTGCHLCDEARVVVSGVCDELGEHFEEVDIDAHPELLARYSEEVPVTFVDGRQHDFWRVDGNRLRAALRG
jgi:glutaredoxin